MHTHTGTPLLRRVRLVAALSGLLALGGALRAQEQAAPQAEEAESLSPRQLEARASRMAANAAEALRNCPTPCSDGLGSASRLAFWRP